jgi:translation elongation factor EF-G
VSQGRAMYTMHFADYVPVPDKVLERMGLK